MEINLFKIFKLGIDYGQLIMEQERMNEEISDAFQCYVFDQKYCIGDRNAGGERNMR